MRKIGDNTVCPYCKNEKTEPQEPPFLPLKTVVGGKYLIGKLVSFNAEGSTYYAFDLSLKRPVTLREFYPRELVTRGEDNYCLVNVGKASAFIDEKSDYLKLWRALKEIDGYSALPDIYEVFEDLGTAYASYEYLGETKTLREYLLNTEQGFVSWEEARVLLMPVLSGLEAVHEKGIIHRGISPGTLVVCPDGRVKLTGFCVADLRNEKSRLEAELFDGYAAVEQYGFEGGQGPFTDVYAFAAVLYRALIGSTPQSSCERIANDKLMIPARFAEQLPAYVINALVNALQILPSDRTNSVELLRAELSASPSVKNAAASYGDEEPKPRPTPNPNPAPPPIKRPVEELDENKEEEEELDEEVPDSAKLKKSTLIAFGISVAVCLAVLLTVIIILKKPASPDGDTTTEASQETEEQDKTEITTGEKDDVISVSVPSFKGEKLDDIKNNETYKSVLNFETDYVDSDEERGTIVSQSLPKGTMVTSINKRTIKLTVSDGRSVPSVENMKKDDAVKALKDAGFKSVETQSGKIATSESESNLVYSVVYLDSQTNDWAQIPGDRRLSAKNKIILYYYAEYARETDAPETTSQSDDTTLESSAFDGSQGDEGVIAED